MVIFIYSNILLSVSMMNLTHGRVSLQPRTATWTVWSTCTKPPKRRRTLRPYILRTNATNPSVYNTSSTTTALYQMVGDTKVENCTHHSHHYNNNNNNNNNTSRARICFKALVITYTQRERDINTPRALLSFLGDSPNWGNPKTKRETRIFRGTPYSRALTLIKTCAQKTETNISADKKRMHFEQRVR